MEHDRDVHSDKPIVNDSVRRSRLGAVSWFIIFVALLHAGLSWDGYVSDYWFSKLCAEPGAIGQFVYHREGLDDTFFIEQNMASSDHHESSYYNLLDGSVIDEAIFEHEFSFEIYRIKRVSEIGPIDLVHSTVTRRSDGLLLGEASSYRNLGDG